LPPQSLAIAQLRELISQLQTLQATQAKADEASANRLQAENERLQVSEGTGG
jgi:hypothetical protein